LAIAVWASPAIASSDTSLRELYATPLSSMSDPRIVSVVVLFAVLALGAALSSGVSAFLLRRRISAQHEELQEKVAKLENLELRQEAVLSAMPDLIFTYDSEARYTGYLRSGSTGYAVDPDLFVGKTIGEIFGDDELQAKTLEAIRRALAGMGPQLFEYCLPMEPQARFEARVVRLADNSALAICRDITERYRAEEQKTESIAEKEALLKEIHHRVKNNMQIVSSLLSMQSARAKDPYDQELFLDSQSRIRAMAAVHDQLYRSKDFSSIPAGEYLSDLVAGLEASWTRPDRWIRASVDADGTALELDRAVPLGLIVNELVTNSFKYAFAPGTSGSISVSVRGSEEGEVCVSVADDGSGFPPGFDPRKGDGGMGYTIINALVMQIRGAIEIMDLGGRGSEVRICAPPPKKAQP